LDVATGTETRLSGDKTMKRIPLTQGRFAIVDDEDYDELTKHRWFFTGHGYAKRYVKDGEPDARKNLFMHRQILGLRFGDKRVVDHINGDGLDNRRSNIRVSNQGTNCQRKVNVFCKRPRRFRGTRRSNGRYTADIRIDGYLQHLGVFDTEEEAAYAYDRKAKEIHGEHALLNYPDGHEVEFTPLLYTWRGRPVERMPDWPQTTSGLRLVKCAGRFRILHFHALRKPEQSKKSTKE